MGFFDATSHQPSSDLHDYTWTIYGPPGVGKTTFASEGDYLIIAFERGYTAMETSAVDLTLDRHPDPRATDKAQAAWLGSTPWERLLLTIAEIRMLAKLPWSGVCIDTVDAAYLACTEHVLAEKGWSHVDDGGDYGKGYDAVNTVFKAAVLRLSRLGVGLGFISHSRDRDFKGRGGVKYQKIVPSLTPSVGKWIIGLSDLVLFADTVPGAQGDAVRVVHTQPSYRFDAKARGRRSTPLPSPLFLDYARFAATFKAVMQGKPVGPEDLPIVLEVETRPETTTRSADSGAHWPSE